MAAELPPPAAAPAPLPPLPDAVDADALRGLDAEALDAADADLAAAERATIAAMSPYERQLREVRGRRAQIATERRRRERAARHAERRSVRELAGSAEMPSLADALAAEPSPFEPATPLTGVAAFLRTGGAVGFGFPTRPGVVTFTDGRRTRQVRTWGEAREAHADGWDPGAPGVPGVRVHLAGTRVERVLDPGDVVVRAADA